MHRCQPFLVSAGVEALEMVAAGGSIVNDPRERQLFEIGQSMPTAHCVSSIEGVILAADQGFLDLVKRPEKDVVGISYRDLTHPDDLDKSARMLATLVDRAPPLRLEKRYLRPDGSTVAATLFVTCFADPRRLVSTLFWNEEGNDLHPKRLWEAALRIQHVNSVRRVAFGDDLATDPVGSLLVAIYLAEAEGRLVGVDQLALSSGMKTSTCLRWLKALQQKDIIQEDNFDINIQFTQTGMMNMENILESVFQLSTSITNLD